VRLCCLAAELPQDLVQTVAALLLPVVLEHHT
jgi:hypothetical protein